MHTHKRFSGLLIGSLLIVAVLGLALSSPPRVVGQNQSTPTHVPPPPRTIPPGLRITPTPVSVKPTSKPPSENPNTPTPLPTPGLLPVAGSPTGGAGRGLDFIIVGGGVGLLALGLILARRSRAK